MGVRKLRRLAGSGGVLAILALAFAALVIPPPVSAQEADYSYVIGNDGKPAFTQRLRWRGDANALRYEFVLYDRGGAEIDRIGTERESVELHLKPGTYGYRLITYNLLDQVAFESEKATLTVLRAELPVIDSIRPTTLYLEGPTTTVRIEGQFLQAEAAVSLVDAAAKGKTKRIAGTVVQGGDGTFVVIEFPRKDLKLGSYLLRLENPGGLAGTSDRPIKIKFQKPVDFFVSIEYAPAIPLYDGFYKENWAEALYPLGGGACAGLYFLKNRFGYFGAEIRGTIRSMEGGEPDATIETVQTAFSADALYAYRLGSAFRLVARLGGGVSTAKLGFDYEGTEGDSMETSDPLITAGVSAQWFFLKSVYGNLGADWSTVFRKGYVEGLVSPSLSFGWYF